MKLTILIAIITCRAAEAKTYGLVDEVIKSRKEAKLLDGAESRNQSLNDRSTAVAEAALPQKVEE